MWVNFNLAITILHRGLHGGFRRDDWRKIALVNSRCLWRRITRAMMVLKNWFHSVTLNSQLTATADRFDLCSGAFMRLNDSSMSPSVALLAQHRPHACHVLSANLISFTFSRMSWRREQARSADMHAGEAGQQMETLMSRWVARMRAPLHKSKQSAATYTCSYGCENITESLSSCILWFRTLPWFRVTAVIIGRMCVQNQHGLCLLC